jgi:hypothetical protein
MIIVFLPEISQTATIRCEDHTDQRGNRNDNDDAKTIMSIVYVYYLRHFLTPIVIAIYSHFISYLYFYFLFINFFFVSFYFYVTLDKDNYL